MGKKQGKNGKKRRGMEDWGFRDLRIQGYPQIPKSLNPHSPHYPHS
jgi:hypothetical protein